MKLLKLSMVFSVVFALLAVSATPADAAFKIKIKKNGKDTYNKVEIKKDLKSLFEQENEKNVDTGVSGELETGENSSKDNNYNGTKIETGKVDIEVTVKNDGDYNELVADPCCEEPTAIGDIVIIENGNDSANKVEVDYESFLKIEQENDSEVDNEVDVELETGDNEAKDNTGGSTSIKTGAVSLKIKIKNLGNINIADVVPCCELPEAAEE